MSDINWQENAVFYAYGKQWFVRDNEDNDLISKEGNSFANSSNVIMRADFQLNEIREGDFIQASELDNKKKFDDAVDMFGLFGFEFEFSADDTFNAIRPEQCIFSDMNGFLLYGSTKNRKGKRLTYHQIIAIGKLKRMMLDREDSEPALMDDNSVQAKLSNIGNVLHNISCSENDEDVQGDLENHAFYLWELSKSMVNEKSAPKTNPDLTPDKQKSAVDYLTECVEVQKQRGEQYDSTGTGERSFNAAAKAYNAMTGGNLKGSDVCLILTCVKAVRQYSNPNRLHEDSLLDLVSYASLWAEELNKELK